MSDFGSDADSSDEIDHDAEDPRARFCFVLASSTEPCDVDQAGEAVTEILGPEFMAEVHDGGVVGVTCGSETIGFLALMPAPVPGGEAEDNADGNFLWPNGREESAAHRSHVIVTVSGGGDPGSPVESAPEEQINVRHLPSRVDPGRTVYKILFGG